jgi:hypothetical protein
MKVLEQLELKVQQVPKARKVQQVNKAQLD